MCNFCPNLWRLDIVSSRSPHAQQLYPSTLHGHGLNSRKHISGNHELPYVHCALNKHVPARSVSQPSHHSHTLHLRIHQRDPDQAVERSVHLGVEIAFQLILFRSVNLASEVWSLGLELWDWIRGCGWRPLHAATGSPSWAPSAQNIGIASPGVSSWAWALICHF